ncbi:PREDICTED: uncharacterized protein LOC107333936 isoform X2 [Acropora digitifera]|uniref:uncharacterized protein LOC107333936 isoform X2 n=1 Tax=Acropora digitifera TaxID=70779 RepID=UPI00077A5EC2|nr:PREDICTED: uncharacterized protein LOC107333936 isoform X2 [Acropora digitifera]
MSEDELCQQASAAQISQGQVLNITLLASEWKSIAGGLSTLNRELAINLSQIQNVRVSLLVPEGACNDEDKREARSFGISILDAKKCVGLDPLVWLSNPPQDHKIDVIVGHGVKLGCQVQLIKRHQNFENCKWVHVVHTAPEDLSKYKGYSEPISKGEKKLWDEVDLCKCADLVVPVGPKLRKAYHGYLQESKKDEDFFELIPGLFEREFADLPAKQNPKDERDDFIVLLCGRGDKEDFEVKGYNIAVEAFADQRLKGKHYCLLFVGSPEGKQDEVQERLLNCGIDKRQLTVREFVKSREKMKELFCEVDMVIMPSKSEGFGLVALEALSAGLPILVGSNSGFARAIENIPFGSYSVVDSGNPAKWAECVEGVRVRHKVVLQENKILKEHYSKDYCWKKQCEELVDRLWKMVYGASTARAFAADDWFEKQQSAILQSFRLPDQRTFPRHMEEGAIISGSQNAKKLGKRKISESNAEHGTWLDEKMGKIQSSEQQLPSVSSQAFQEPHAVHKSRITEEEKALATYENKKYLREFGETLIMLLISAPHLNEEQSKAVHTMLSMQVKTFVEVHDHPTDKLKGLGALAKFITETYKVFFKRADVGSLIIILNCQTFESLELLWNDSLSGHLDKVAERYLVTSEMKQRLNLETVNLKTTIAEENYLNCRKILTGCSGEADRTPLFSRQGGLDPETSMIEKATPGGEEEVLVNQENTDLLTRTEKARASRSALHKASVDGQYEEVKRHLSSGCAVDVKDQFLLTPLHLACWYGQESVVKLLLEHGADVNATDKFQFTPLHKAERRNHLSIVKLLLEHKARPTLQQPPSLRTLGRRAFTRTDEHSGFNLLQAAVLEGDHDTVTKASVHLENFVEEMNCRTTGEKASISPGKSAADILSNVKGRMESHPLIGAIYEEFVETEKTLTQLHLCAKSNDVEIAIELVLNDGMDVNVAANRNITPLVWASPATSSMSIKTLIDLGADVNAQTFQESTFGFCSGTALRSAIHGSNANVVKVLLANKADANIADLQGNTVLHSSTSKRFFNVSQVLIDSGSKVNERNNDGETSLHSAVHGKNVPVVKLLLRNNAETNIQDDEGNTPLHISTREGLCDISQLLVDSGCKINVRNNCGETPLHSCVRGENAAAVKLLIKNNADANVQDTWGDTPLHISTRRGLCDISQLLVDSDCKINMRNIGGETPLHSSVRGENAAEVKLLLKNNADANIQDNQGDTPLHTSSRRGFSSISQLLIDSGCNKNLKNRKGKTPLDLKSSPYPSYSPGSYPPCPPYSPDRGDSKEAKANEEHTYAPWKGFRRKSFFESEHKGYPLVRQPTLPTLSSPLLGKPRSGLLLKNRPELSSALRKRRMDYVLSPTLYGDLEEDTGYASQRVLPHKIVFGSEDED